MRNTTSKLKPKGSRTRALVHTVGMHAPFALLKAEQTALCGPRYQHDPQRAANRHGSTQGELVLGGRRVRVRKPRVRSVDGQELKLPTWEQFSNEDPLDQRATEQMLVGVSTRKYARSPLRRSRSSFSVGWIPSSSVC